ncbi:MAG TPA: hypothetical protein VHS58_01590 [Acetobacteraceae bacterium]|jgi:hypothetical protein|nr:hypothetical protein [Acetobacteraceae bacterium]
MLHRTIRLWLGCILLCGLAGCTAEIVPPYDEAIDSGAHALRSDFLKFVAERQRTANTAAGTYASSASTYSDLLAKLGAIELRAEDQPNGVDCAQMQVMFARVHTGISSFDAAAVGSAASNASGGGSCIAVLARIASKQIENLRKDDERRCASIPATASCIDLFGSESVASIVASVHATPSATIDLASAARSSPFVKAVLVSLDELAGAEQDLKSAAGK